MDVKQLKVRFKKEGIKVRNLIFNPSANVVSFIQPDGGELSISGDVSIDTIVALYKPIAQALESDCNSQCKQDLRSHPSFSKEAAAELEKITERKSWTNNLVSAVVRVVRRMLKIR